ncbi:MAG TPA: hypothetical protein VF629_07975 [Hymenobacter sp.]|jgi:hypothetical protein|uniref:hypothetical protein n=1 Tax=Hymenobacter sp. TaxID=1898978 RepID=UPI002ED9E3DA
MPPENIDDLFRDKLDGHVTPPADDLWARLQAASADEAAPEAPAPRIDHLFQHGLNGHATPPSRELWERLEDEHLRPVKRRAAAWWPMAIAAALALLLVAGGAGLWLGFPARTTEVATVPAVEKQPGRNKAQHPAGTVATNATTGNGDKKAGAEAAAEQAASAAGQQPTVAANTPQQQPTASAEAAVQKKMPPEATRSGMVASTAPKARISAPGQSPRRLTETSRRPDAAASRLPQVAQTTARPARPTAADEPRQAPETTPVVAVAPQVVPAPENVPAVAASALAHSLITVDVRTGEDPAARPTKTVGTALAGLAEPEERRRLGGRLLQQAGHLVRGERVSLAEVTGLPENVTVRATVAGRSLTKSIQL